MPYKDLEKRREARRKSDAKYREKKKQQDETRFRTRNYATVVYPESAPENWKEYLSELHIPLFISPLHDKDINPDGEMKKPHYHVLFMFNSVKSWEQIKPIFEAIGGVGREVVNSARGYARYLCHLDNPEKAQYDTNNVIVFGGADYATVIHLPTDDIKMLKEIYDYIRINQIYSLAQFLDICAVINDDWFSLVSMSKGYIVDKYIKSLTWEDEHGYIRKPVVDPQTGEMIDSNIESENGVQDAACGRQE